MLITIIHDTAGITKPEYHDVDRGTPLIDFLINRYGPDGFGMPAIVFRGSLSEKNVVDKSEFMRPITENITICHNPLGLETIAYIALVVVVAAVMKPPELPTGSVAAVSSPNNQVTEQTNIARPMNRIPDIFGEVLSYPDLINPSAFEYIDHIKYITEYMCVSRGYVDIADMKSGDTLISSIEGSEVTVYEPYEVPEDIPITATSNEVASQILSAPNDARVALNSYKVWEYPSSHGVAKQVTKYFYASYDESSDVGTISCDESGQWDEFSEGDVIYLSDVHILKGSLVPPVSDIQARNLDGAYTIENKGSKYIELSSVSSENANWDWVQSNDKILDTYDGEIYSPILSTSSLNYFVGPISVPSKNFSEIWLDFQAPQGLLGGSSLDRQISVTIDIELMRVFDSANRGNAWSQPYIITKTFTGKTRDPLFWTVKLGAGQLVTEGALYDITVRRTSDSDNTTDLDKLTWTRLASIRYVNRVDEDGTTRIKLLTKATDQVASIQERKFNCIATRKVLNIDDNYGISGNIKTGNGLIASRKFSDIFAHYALDPKLGARSQSNIDIVALKDIQNDLDAVFNGEKGEFSFTFDNENTPALEEMRQILDAARCFMTRQGSFISAVRDQAQYVSRALFNRRNKKPNSEIKTIRFNKPVDNDGVTLEFYNRSTQENQTISLPQDLPENDPNYGLPEPSNPKKIQSAGIKNYSQAWDRAQYELNRIIYQRVSVETTVTAEGATLPLNARVSHVDANKIDPSMSDGEIIGIEGNKIETSEPCVFIEGSPDDQFMVRLRDEDGNESQETTEVSPRTDGKNGFTFDYKPPFAVWTRGENGYQRGTLYTFGNSGSHEAERYLLQKRAPVDDFYYKLELINYDRRYYQADDQEPPEL